MLTVKYSKEVTGHYFSEKTKSAIGNFFQPWNPDIRSYQGESGHAWGLRSLLFRRSSQFSIFSIFRLVWLRSAIMTLTITIGGYISTFYVVQYG